MNYVSSFPQEVQDHIRKDLHQALQAQYEGEELEMLIEDGMASRLNDLSDTITIKPYL